jgi:hypothetical protein
MNTTPDEVTLALWLDDELEGDEFAKVEAWVADKPEQLAAREETRRWRARMSVLPAVEEPAYADFFNHRIQRAIAGPAVPEVAAQPGASGWRVAWWMPASAAAGMALTFWLGTRIDQSPAPVVVTQPAPVVAPALYTPDVEVKADYFSSAKAGATVIVLDGVAAIPDDREFPETSASEPARKGSSAALESTDLPQ